MDGTVLIADDDRTIRTVLTQAMTRAGCRVHATSSLTTLLRWVGEGKGDLVVSDVVMPDGNGLEMLPRIAELRPDLPVIVISAQNTIMTAIQAAEADAFDYLPKPFDLPDLMKRAARALAQKRTVSSGDAPRDARPENLPMIGASPQMQELYRMVARVLNSDIPVLISGESGTGKSLIARAIHDFSDRRSAPLVVADAARLERADGFERLAHDARGGCILFDEVGDYSPDIQSRLTRFLDQAGPDGPRILSTSQADLEGAGSFRPDLFYRLGGVRLKVPTLRDRLDDIPLLAQHFLHRESAEQGGARRMSKEAQSALRQANWPGNVRQLENAICQLVMTGTTEDISASEVKTLLGESQPLESRPDTDGKDRLSASVQRHLQRYFDLHGGTLPPDGLYQRILREVEQPLLEIALDATGGNQARCADLLGINRNTLRKKLTDLDIRVTRRRKLM